MSGWGAFAEWAQRRPKNPGRAGGPHQWPWLDAARSVACGWCGRDFAACYCLENPRVRRAGPAIDLAAFLSALPKWCRTCRAKPCSCSPATRYRDKMRAAGRCPTCRRVSKGRCPTCRADIAILNRERRRRNIAAGRCQTCGRRPPAAGRRNCRSCLATARTNAAERYRRSVARAGLDAGAARPARETG